MAKKLQEMMGGESCYYSGSIREEGPTQAQPTGLLARLELLHGCEAHLAVLLLSAAQNGVLDLELILPLLKAKT